MVYYSSKFFNVNQQISLAEENAVVYVHIYQNGEVIESLENPVSVTFYHPQSTWVSHKCKVILHPKLSNKTLTDPRRMRRTRAMTPQKWDKICL